MKSPFRTLLLGAAFLALPLAASAAEGFVPGPGGPPGGPDGGMHRMHRPGEHGERMAEHLRAVLQLTPAQEPALTTFLAAMKPQPHPGWDGKPMPEHGPPPAAGPAADPAARKAEFDKRRAEFQARRDEMEKKHAEEAALSTPQRLDLMVKRMEERTARRDAEMKAHVSAVKTFYAALTPAQQKAFDALHGGMMHGGMGHGGMHEGGPMHGGRMGMMDPMGPPPPMAMEDVGPGPGAPPPRF